MPRNAQLTRQKILAAAIAEFSTHGHAGARVDRIAAMAGVNKRMIYHHFGSKAGVFEAVLADRPSAAAITDQQVRLWMHEALERGDENIQGFDERRQSAEKRVAEARRRQQGGDLPRESDPALLTLAELALAVFPVAFPQIVRIVAGNRARSPEFGAAWADLVNDWYRGHARPVTKPRLRLDRERVSRAARHRGPR